MPAKEKYGSLSLEYQKRLKGIEDRYTSPIGKDVSPFNGHFNGGVDIIHKHLTWDEVYGDFNDSSVVMSYFYSGTMIVFPGDIEPFGWGALIEKYPGFLDTHLRAASTRILVAPHHGRSSGYSQDMIDYIEPHAVVVSDGYGAGATDSRYYSAGLGLDVWGETKQCISTKMNGRKLIKCAENGSVFIDG